MGCALVLLAACGARTNRGEDDEGAGEGTDESGGTESGGDTSGDTEGDEAQCTYENYENHADVLDELKIGCFPLPPDGVCEPCDLECAESILVVCGESGTGLGDVALDTSCYDHLVLCSELVDGECCHLVTARGSLVIPGRPIRRDGGPGLPALLGCPISDGGHRVADGYRMLARFERASVDAFERAADLLEQVGAPPELVVAHRVAAQEEAGHAELALAAAAAFDGGEVALGEMPAVPVVDLEPFVRDLVRDGCIGEAVAAREARWALARVSGGSPAYEFWKVVAVEEAGHAALAWRTLEWLLERFPELGGVVISQLRAASQSAYRTTESETDPELAQAGIADGKVRSDLYRATMDELLVEARSVLSAT